jgi:hypothetical protein
VAEGNFVRLEMAMMVRECRAKAVDGSNGLKRASAASLAMATIVGWVSVIPAHAAPPTVTPSPGYDSRLQEQRTSSVRVYEPVAPVTKPVAPRRTKRTPVH